MTKPNRSTVARQQRHVLSRAENADAYGFFNLLTGPELLADLESLLPEHRERLFPPTEPRGSDHTNPLKNKNTASKNGAILGLIRPFLAPEPPR